MKPGTRIGVYEIVAAIGAGGMGEVYRARDTKLQRDVAVKVLPDLFVKDPERLARFEREARTLAALNHPHIAQVYGVEGTALVMEFVDGDDLSQRLGRAGAIPIDEALPIARQIAEAVEAAHEQGIIHRDLKPANIKVRPDGTVKVLDFGLAKALVPEVASATADPTITSPFQVSQLGVILGTAAYMAPEQAKGKPVDKRADIWAFGCVLYELLTAKRPFAGEDVTDTLAAIVRADPDWTALPVNTPPAMRRLLARCLVKDAKRRLRDIGDARLVIEETIAGGGRDEALPAATGRRRGVSPAWLAATIPVVIAAALAGWMLKPAPSPLLRKFELATDGLQSGLSVAPVISPDGASLAYVAGGRLMVRQLDQLTPRELAAPADGVVEALFWSPDGAFVGYGSGKKLWKVSRTGGGSAAVCGLPESGRLLGATWGADDTIVFSAWRGSMYRVSARGGTPVVLLAMDPSTEIDFHDPRFLPDGRRLTFIPHPKFGPIHQIESLTNGVRAVLFDVGTDTVTDGNYSQGHLLLTRTGGNSGIWALPFDLAGLKPTGDPFLVAAGGASVSVGADGTLLYVAVSTGDDLDQLAWLDRTGRVVEPIGDPRTAITGPTLSPDGRRIAFSAQENDNVDVWVHDLGRGGATRVTSSPEPETEPAWSPRGDSLLYVRGGRRTSLDSRIFLRNIDEGTPERDLGEGRMPSLSPDGRLLVHVNQRAGNGTIGVLRLPDGGGPATPAEWRPGSNNERGGEVSPDGRLLAYMSAESGRSEVYLRRFPDGSGRWLVSTEGGREPHWAGKSGELFYISGTGGADRSMTVATVTHAGNAVTVGKPVTLYKDSEIFFRTIAPGFDVSPDGQRILTVKRAQPKDARGPAREATPRMIVVQNWLSEFAGKR